MNIKRIKFLVFGLVAVLGISAGSFATINNNVLAATKSSSETAVATRTPTGWARLSTYFKNNPSGVLRYGDYNDGVRGLNGLLFDYGYLDATDDTDFSDFTSDTRSAVRALQRHLGVTVTGKFTASDWNAVQNDYIN